MDCIELMVEEHKLAKRLLVVIRRYCYNILKNEDIDYNDFFVIIDFIKTYVDGHHHGKEEELLFNQMKEKLGPVGQKLITHGMLVEHDLGRLYVHQMDAAVRRVIQGDDESRLDVIANAIAYCDLLNRHIDKEDSVVYKYATSNLDKDTFELINKECEDFEKTAKGQGVQEKYLKILEKMEQN